MYADFKMVLLVGSTLFICAVLRHFIAVFTERYATLEGDYSFILIINQLIMKAFIEPIERTCYCYISYYLYLLYFLDNILIYYVCT